MFVASYNHVKSGASDQNWVYVDTSKEAADIYIMNHCLKGDIVVTQDIGLASTLLPRAVYALSPRGTLFDEKEIITALEVRYLKAKARKRGIYGKGPKPFREEDRQKFKKELTKILSKFAGI